MNVPQETRLVRSFPSGKKIHRRGCVHAGRVVPWAWAEDKQDAEWIHVSWLEPCGHCLPTLYSFRKHLAKTEGLTP